MALDLIFNSVDIILELNKISAHLKKKFYKIIQYPYGPAWVLMVIANPILFLIGIRSLNFSCTSIIYAVVFITIPACYFWYMTKYNSIYFGEVKEMLKDHQNNKNV